MNPAPVPTSTYRVQFGPHFRFTDGTDLVPYLDELGVGWLYASPYFRARPGSEHGYDVVDHNQLNPEIGDESEQRTMIAALHARGMGHLLDFVPNHMGVGDDNPWWRDVLALGRLSHYADFFDIDWHARSNGRGKVVLPVLGDHYGRVVERGEFGVAFDRATGTFVLRYFDHTFPLAPPSCAAIIERAAAAAGAPEAALREFAAAFAALRGIPRDGGRREALRGRIAAVARSFAERMAADATFARAIDDACAAFPSPERIDALIRAQHYRPAYWRTAADEINYRRFFDINDLAGLRIESADVLARTHELVFAMMEDGRVDGLRIDHVDGLANPGGYVNLLADRAAAFGHPLYLVIEKILLGEERLRPGWRVAGTTGYDFMNLVLGLFVDPRAEHAFDRIVRRVAGRSDDFATEAGAAKRRIMRLDLASELFVLADALARIARSDRRSSDFTALGLRRALTNTIAAFPVYRTYVVDERITGDDRAVIDAAAGAGAAQAELADPTLYAFVADALAAQLAREPGAHYDRTELLRFVLRFQQYTGPVMAKSLEDTAFYRYVRLSALNEVGGEPARFGRSVAEFHAANAERARTHPHAMLATATHDHKRGEDTRLRIAALTEFPAEWSRAVVRWSRLNAARRDAAHDAPAPAAEYLLYQTIVGTLPESVDEAYADRMVAYAVKAAREAKLRTSWSDPNAAYETALENFVRGVLQPGDPFVSEARALVEQIAPVAAVHGLAQVTLKLTAPGVPDTYQGCEFWDHSLVDPDNRRPVDYAARHAALRTFARRDDRAALCDELLAAWPDGRIKLYLTWRLLHLRRERAATFAAGRYRPLVVDGVVTDGVVAYARDDVIVAAPRLVRSRRRTGTVSIADDGRLQSGFARRRFRNVFDGRVLDAGEAGELDLRAVFAALPVAVLIAAD